MSAKSIFCYIYFSFFPTFVYSQFHPSIFSSLAFSFPFSFSFCLYLCSQLLALPFFNSCTSVIIYLSGLLVSFISTPTPLLLKLLHTFFIITENMSPQRHAVSDTSHDIIRHTINGIMQTIVKFTPSLTRCHVKGQLSSNHQ